MSGLALLPVVMLQFASLSLVAFGGINAVLPELQRIVVVEQQWMGPETFAHLFAIAQAAPGPNLLIVGLLGWHVASLPGAVLALASFLTPSVLIVYATMRVWERFRTHPWRAIVQRAIAPLAVGLVTASGLLITVSVTERPSGWGLMLGTCAIALWTRIHPLWFIGAGAVIGGLMFS